MDRGRKRVLVGFCPIGKFVFSHEDALRQKQLIEQKMQAMGVNYVGIDDVIADGMVRDIADVNPVVEHLRAKGIDCLFMPHCNFGTESAVGLIGKRLQVPVLIWGPRDGYPLADGTRLRDSLCGMFASTKVLNTMQVPFSYIENCAVDEEVFEEGFDLFLRSANIVRQVRGARIGMIGNRIDFFWSTIINENELLQKFGIEVLPFDLISVVARTRELAGKNIESYREEFKKLSEQINTSVMTEAAMINMLALRDVMLGMAEKFNLQSIAVESFMTITEELGAMISYAQAMVSDAGIPCITESDIHGAISSIIAEAAGFNTEPSFFADLTIRHPENDNGMLLWHDSFPYSLKKPDTRAAVEEHWILPDINPGTCHWELKEGEITIVRFDADSGRYSVLAEKAHTIPGPYTKNTYVWVEFENWKAFERKVMEGPYIHHVACVYGDCRKAVQEACKFIDGVRFDA